MQKKKKGRGSVGEREARREGVREGETGGTNSLN